MTIREKGYHSWDGQLKPSRLPWLPIFLNGIKTVFKKKYAKALFGLSISPFLIFMVGIYVSTRPELQMMSHLVRLLKNESAFFNAFLTNGFTTFMLIVLGVFFGAELISGDSKFNAFPLYFSRPLDRKDYILGKFAIVLFYFYIFTLAPGILLYIFKMIFTGSLAINPITLMALILTPLLTTFYIASITLMVSSLSGNTRYVKIIIFVIYVFSQLIAKLLEELFGNSYFNLISIKNTIEQLGSFLFNAGLKYSYPGWLSIIVILGVSLGACSILYKRIGKSEAQIETGN